MSILQCLTYHMVQTSHPYITTGKTIALISLTFVGKVISLLCNMLSRFVMLSSKDQASFNFMPKFTICSDFRAHENKVCYCFHCFPTSSCHEVMGPGGMIFIFWMLSFKPAFSLSTFTFIKRLFSSSLSTTRVVSSAYLSLLVFLPANLIPAYASSRPAFHMMPSAYKLNKLSDKTQLCVHLVQFGTSPLFHVWF